jgi:hypothetical protein
VFLEGWGKEKKRKNTKIENRERLTMENRVCEAVEGMVDVGDEGC